MQITVELTREEAEAVKDLWSWHPANEDHPIAHVFSVRKKIVEAIKRKGN